jgi:mannose-6-phosphate isomerase-like protein (cupin superfamily)
MKDLKLTTADNKNEIFELVENYLQQLNLRIDKKDFHRPWGGFFVIEERDTEIFLQCFYPHLKKEDVLLGNKLSPKILVVAPNKRLSWQYHYRRAEIWKLIAGEAGVVTSLDDDEAEEKEIQLQEIITLQQGERHRLVGLNNFGVIAEIWQHTNPEQPSDEDDIVRLQDDFGR